jgi:hypothetical protein
MLTPMLPTSCQVGRMSFGWWTILDTDGKLLRVKPSSVAVLDTNWCTWHLLSYPVQRRLNLLSFPFTLWMAHIHNLESQSLSCPLPFIYTDLSGFNKWPQSWIIAFTWINLVSLSWKEQFLKFFILSVAVTLPVPYAFWLKVMEYFSSVS